MIHSRICAVLPLALALLGPRARADIDPEWIAKLPVGAALTAGLQGMVVDPAGVAYVTGNSGPSSNTDVVTAAVAPNGSLVWSHTFNGPANWHDQARGIALGPGGVLWVTGNTPGPGSYANVLLLKFDAASGALLQTIQYSSGPFTSEHGAAVATDAAGDVYVGGGTVGDGGDGMLLKFSAAGQFLWKQVWDGPALAPYSQDTVLQVHVDPSGAPVALVHGVMASLHPDFVVLKLAPSDGSTLWQATWGVNGEDWPVDMVLDPAGDVYVTGMGLQLNNKYSTIKLRGSDGLLLWQAYDQGGLRDSARAIALDGQGGVCITGSVDPDGDQSNQNDNIYTVRRDAATGALSWTHLYGANCIGCLDVPGDVAVDPAGNVFVGGTTYSPPYSADAIILVLNLSSGVEIERGIVSGAGASSAAASILRFDADDDLYCGGRTYGFNTGEVEILVFEYASLAASQPTLYCSSKVSSCGSLSTLGGPSATASVAAGAGGYDVTCAPVPAGQRPAVIVYTTNGAAASPFNTSFGWLCIQPGPGMFRVPQPAFPQGSGCAAGYTFDFGNYLATQTVNPALVAGASVDLQVWYRDPTNPGGANLSNAMAFGLVP